METMKMAREPEPMKAKGKHELEHMRITLIQNGGHIVRHEFKRTMAHSRTNGMGYDRPEDEEHVFGKGERGKLMAHIAKHLGVKGGDGAREMEENDEV